MIFPSTERGRQEKERGRERQSMSVCVSRVLYLVRGLIRRRCFSVCRSMCSNTTEVFDSKGGI